MPIFPEPIHLLKIGKVNARYQGTGWRINFIDYKLREKDAALAF
jgi:hypothetical protein